MKLTSAVLSSILSGCDKPSRLIIGELMKEQPLGQAAGEGFLLDWRSAHQAKGLGGVASQV